MPTEKAQTRTPPVPEDHFDGIDAEHNRRLEKIADAEKAAREEREDRLTKVSAKRTRTEHYAWMVFGCVLVVLFISGFALSYSQDVTKAANVVQILSLVAVVLAISGAIFESRVRTPARQDEANVERDAREALQRYAAERMSEAEKYQAALHAAERAREQERWAEFPAWAAITSAFKQPGNGGRTQALETLAKKGVSLERVEVPGADLSNVALPGQNLNHTNMEGCVLHHADLHGASLHGAHFNNADCYKANLAGVRCGPREEGERTNPKDFARSYREWLAGNFDPQIQEALAEAAYDWPLPADFSEARLICAVLDDADFYMVALDGANLFHAQLRGTDFTEASLRGAHLSLTDLSQLKSVAGADFSDAVLSQTKWDPTKRLWLELKSIEGAIVGSAKPVEFLDWALQNGAIKEAPQLV